MREEVDKNFIEDAGPGRPIMTRGSGDERAYYCRGIHADDDGRDTGKNVEGQGMERGIQSNAKPSILEERCSPVNPATCPSTYIIDPSNSTAAIRPIPEPLI